MKESILSLVRERRLYAGGGACGGVRAFLVENVQRALLLTVAGRVEAAPLRQAVAVQAGLPEDHVWVLCQGGEVLPAQQALEEAQQAVAAALANRQPAAMATLRRRDFGPAGAPDGELTMLRFDDAQGKGVALLVNLPVPCDAAALARSMESLVPGRLTLVLPAVCCEGEISLSGLAEKLCDLAEQAVNPVWTPDVTVASIAVTGQPAGGILYIGRTILMGFHQRLPAACVLALRGAFPNDRMLPMAWDAQADAFPAPQDAVEAACQEMKRCVDISRTLPQVYLDAVEHKYLDLAYAPQSAGQQLDIWLPDAPAKGPYPVIVYCHGGAFAYGWQRGNDVIPMLCGLDRGYAVVSLQYRLSGEARFPAALYDAKAALRYLRAHADAYGLDMGRVFLWGASAGAWLVAMTAATEGNPAMEDLTHGEGGPLAGNVRGVVAWCGPYDLTPESCPALTPEELARDAASPFSRFLGCATSLVPELCLLASPLTHVNPATPPFLLISGTGDELVSPWQAEKMYHALRQARPEAGDELLLEEGRPHHGDSWYHEPWVIARCLNFMDKHQQ